jgi:hypothetical protein
MEEDPWGSSAWVDAPSTSSPPAKLAPAFALAPPPAPSAVIQTDDFDDFDDFGDSVAPVASAAGGGGEDDDDFGDFGDFGEVSDTVVEQPLVEEPAPYVAPPARQLEMLRLHPGQPRAEIREQVERLIEPLFPRSEVEALTTGDGIREVGGLNQILVTEERYGMFSPHAHTRPTAIVQRYAPPLLSPVENCTSGLPRCRCNSSRQPGRAPGRGGNS